MLFKLHVASNQVDVVPPLLSLTVCAPGTFKATAGNTDCQPYPLNSGNMQTPDPTQCACVAGYARAYTSNVGLDCNGESIHCKIFLLDQCKFLYSANFEFFIGRTFDMKVRTCEILLCDHTQLFAEHAPMMSYLPLSY